MNEHFMSLGMILRAPEGHQNLTALDVLADQIAKDEAGNANPPPGIAWLFVLGGTSQRTGP